MTEGITVLTLDNPVFRVYTLTASIMILKLMVQPWITVWRMTKVSGGYRSPEDARRSPLNPQPRDGQLNRDEYVDRSRRINLNDLESIPAYLAAGMLFVLVEPPLLLAQVLCWTYVGMRGCHFVAYMTAQLHDVRATFWTFSSLVVLTMAVYTLVQAA